MAVMGSPAAVKSGRHQCPNLLICLSMEAEDPQTPAVSSMCPAGPPAPVHAAWVPACPPSVCATCGPVERAGARRCGPSGAGFKACPLSEPNRGQRDPRLGPHGIPADISPLPRLCASSILSPAECCGGRGVVYSLVWSVDWPAPPGAWLAFQGPGLSYSSASGPWCWGQQGLLLILVTTLVKQVWGDRGPARSHWSHHCSPHGWGQAP